MKTKNVEKSAKNSDAGAMICLLETLEESRSIDGTNEWTDLDFIFNSKNRDKVKVAFRLGGNTGNCKGTAWFSDLKIEEGIPNNENDTEWKFACFIFKNIKIEGQDNMNVSMTLNDIESVKINLQRFQSSCESLSEGKMKVKYDVYEINEPITTLSYSDEYKYHIAPEDVKELISDTILDKEYDHVMAIVRTGDDNSGIAVNVGDWIGLRRNGNI